MSSISDFSLEIKASVNFVLKSVFIIKRSNPLMQNWQSCIMQYFINQLVSLDSVFSLMG